MSSYSKFNSLFLSQTYAKKKYARKQMPKLKSSKNINYIKQKSRNTLIYILNNMVQLFLTFKLLKYYHNLGVIDKDLEELQAKLQEINAQFLKSKIPELKHLKEDAGKIVEVFVYIQTGKENNFENAKGYLMKQNTIDLNINFMDTGSIELIKLQEVWTSRRTILESIKNQKQYQKHQQILKQMLDWILIFYEIIIKQEILKNIETMYQEYSEKKEFYIAQFIKNEFIYKYYKQLYQQLQNYITAIKEENPLVDEAFAESLTKLVEEIFRKDSSSTKDEKEEDFNAEYDKETVDIKPKEDDDYGIKQKIKSNIYFDSKQQLCNEDEIKRFDQIEKDTKLVTTNLKLQKTDSRDSSEMKIVTTITGDNKSHDNDQEQENTSFKKLLNEHKSFQSKKRNAQSTNTVQTEQLETLNLDLNNKLFQKQKSNSSHAIKLNENKKINQQMQNFLNDDETNKLKNSNQIVTELVTIGQNQKAQV
ncbi:hypothetical protein TTHERM_00688580 (macronuclear) [Tetrahymena thermophila SB210]|uniref:Uncharacterized protein n=1 Tax=Tetrahymena thermophila (strain SB210) TaxID=312017 RepID=I7M4F4_TETTS|nr:hypothetical protein TTHERM_00688580 [Tetrahymena thermophila SB210]EAS06718.2 hypothetical protein TTHERM_00688580 [Tetrahymena thermophila SB210]|eukprot:XP_001026960.2 hypothetical protein TTHERM_00688580 [Tetrahymena thermophila SB210]